MTLRPPESDADHEAALLGRLRPRTGVAGDVEAGDGQAGAGAADLHDRIQDGGRVLLHGVGAVAAGLGADAIDGAVDFRHAQDLLNLLRQRGRLLEVHRLAAKASRLCESLVDHVAHDDDGRAQ